MPPHYSHKQWVGGIPRGLRSRRRRLKCQQSFFTRSKKTPCHVSFVSMRSGEGAFLQSVDRRIANTRCAVFISHKLRPVGGEDRVGRYNRSLQTHTNPCLDMMSVVPVKQTIRSVSPIHTQSIQAVRYNPKILKITENFQKNLNERCVL